MHMSYSSFQFQGIIRLVITLFFSTEQINSDRDRFFPKSTNYRGGLLDPRSLYWIFPSLRTNVGTV